MRCVVKFFDTLLVGSKQMHLSRKLKAPTFYTLSQPLSTAAAAAAGDIDVDDVAKLVDDHPLPIPRGAVPAAFLSSPLLDSLLLRLFAAHSAAHKAAHLFRLALHGPSPPPSPSALATTLHILTRARLFDSAFELVEDVARRHPHLLTSKSLAVLLSRFAKFRSFDETLAAFDRAERAWAAGGLSFGPDEFSALLRAYCVRGRVGEARAVFRRLHSRFPPNSRILNTLLLGFKESGDLLAFDLFYHEMTARGFEPDAVTYCIRMDAYCKKVRLSDALDLLNEMRRKNFSPTVKTMTTLIHGAGIAKNPQLARSLFEEMRDGGLCPDRGAYNALMGAFVRVGDFNGAMEVVDEMEKSEFGLDDVTYNTLFCGLKKYEDLGGFWRLYNRMVDSNFVPMTRTVMLLMKVFCEKGRADLGLELWNYLIEKGCCPHRHALDLLVTGLCCRGKVLEAYGSFRQVVDRGRVPSERACRVLEGFLARNKELDKVKEIQQVMEKLQAHAPSACQMVPVS